MENYVRNYHISIYKLVVRKINQFRTVEMPCVMKIQRNITIFLLLFNHIVYTNFMEIVSCECDVNTLN